MRNTRICRQYQLFTFCPKPSDTRILTDECNDDEAEASEADSLLSQSRKAFPMTNGSSFTTAPAKGGPSDLNLSTAESTALVGRAPMSSSDGAAGLSVEVYPIVEQVISVSPSPAAQGESDLLTTPTDVMAPHQIAYMAMVFSPMWLAAGYTFNLSLCTLCHTGTSVASNTVISSTTSLWALLISVVLLGEKASWGKLAAVVLSCVGAAVITSDDKGESSVAGDWLCLFSAIGFGLASVLLKAWSPKDDSINYPMFFGFLGLFHTILCIPILFLMDYYGFETFARVDEKLIIFLTVNGLFGTVLSNVCECVHLTTFQLDHCLVLSLAIRQPAHDHSQDD